MKKIISVMGPHAGESAESIFERKIEDVKKTGLTFWCVGSYKAKPDQVLEFCKTTQVEVYFVSPSSPGGAKDTKIETKNTQYSIDKENWLKIPENITPVTGKGYALILDQLQNVDRETLNLNNFAEFNKNTPLKFAKEWHPTKNKTLTPKDITARSSKKVWWICKNGHEWLSVIRFRTQRGTGCPVCSGHKAGKNNNLAVQFPQIAKEWHPTKNGDLTPKDVTYGSGKQVWWKCSKGHNWQTTAVSRSKGKSCPYCGRQKRI